MKIKFLRAYRKHKIGEELEITLSDTEKKYLLSTGTIKVLEEDKQEEEGDNQEENPQDPPQDEEEKAGKNGKKGSKK